MHFFRSAQLSYHIRFALFLNASFFLSDSEMHVINFKTEKEPKMKFFDFEAIRKNGKSLHDRIMFHMLFGAFNKTPRNGTKNVNYFKTNALTLSPVEFQNHRFFLKSCLTSVK